MTTNLESMDVEQLLAEADELIEQINSDIIKHLKEEDRLQLEIQAQNLEKIKSQVQEEIEKKGVSNIGSGGEGIHKALLEIVKATRDLTKFLS